MVRVLIIGKTETEAAELARRYLPPGARVTACTGWKEAVRLLRQAGSALELIVFQPNGPREDFFRQVRSLMAATAPAMGGTSARLLCLLRSYQGPDVELLIEQLGARVAYE